MDWIDASWFVSDAVPLSALYELVMGAFTRLFEIPIIGPGLACAFMPVVTAFALAGAFVALGLVVVVLLGSALLGGAIDMILGGTTQLIDAIERLTRLVHGA